jgi:mannose-6-phosphate isomerase-like protein (cupin superfamily)
MTDHIIHAHDITETWFQEGCFIMELSNRATDPEVSIARARVAPGQQTAWHSLTEVTERYLITEGAGLVEIGDEAPAPVGAGDVVSIPAGVRQRIRNSGSADLVFYAICSPRFTPECYQALTRD